MLDGILHFVQDSLKIKAGANLSASPGAPSGIHAMGIRPDAIRLVPSTSAPIAGRVMLTEIRGPEAVVTVEVGSINLKVLTQPDTIYREGASVGLSMDPSDILFYSKKTSRRINLAPLWGASMENQQMIGKDGTVLSVEKLSKQYRGMVAVDDISFSIPAGSLTIILGPAGAGKTTTLRMIAGLEYPDKGRISLSGADSSGLEPKDRDIAMIFDNLALYPDKTGFENIANPLKIRKFPKEEQERLQRELGSTFLLATPE